MTTLAQFEQDHTGQSLLFNLGYSDLRGQCVQLVCFYAREVVDSGVMYADAVDWWDNFTLGQWYDKVPYPGNLPKRGDIVVFSADTPGSAGAGHIDICLEDGGINTFIGFDSNWNGKTAHRVNHDYKYVKGFLRPKGSTMNDGTVQNLYLAGWQRPATADELKQWTGKPMQQFFDTGGKNQYEYLWQQIRERDKQIADLKAVTPDPDAVALKQLVKKIAS